jgi:hypothetical protein
MFEDAQSTPVPAENRVISNKEKVGRAALSGLLGALVGVVIAEIVANSLIEISLSPVFSIVRFLVWTERKFRACLLTWL